ncbi:MAG: hypothetical protein OP8BY_1788 [Candidatus Saccharicenans subterraneus]|uniref:Uncharacterized protein n=1 Tax=Candidatus Saccharicenans subterraneus TaxID=2508984 RepID=A0A3E2BNA1_9BACT|nr:MAG: hypothetical protein OP8BY_1788 [Candidatus Saccharicenans subterraneum]
MIRIGLRYPEQSYNMKINMSGLNGSLFLLIFYVNHFSGL